MTLPCGRSIIARPDLLGLFEDVERTFLCPLYVFRPVTLARMSSTPPVLVEVPDALLKRRPARSLHEVDDRSQSWVLTDFSTGVPPCRLHPAEIGLDGLCESYDDDPKVELPVRLHNSPGMLGKDYLI